MKKYLSFGIVGFILSLILAYFGYSLGNKPNDILFPFYQVLLFAMLLYFIPLLLVGLFLDMSKKRKIFKILAIIILILVALITAFLVLLSFSFKFIS
ncbi:MAG: hypothetical protein Q8N99_00335 [Nanoarchaeota archaeon]|nr:hypothetical protein [Nanoarchaeota archaeon]